MRYFKMYQDTSLPYCIPLRDFSITQNTYYFTKEDQERLNDTTVLYLEGDGDEVRPDFIQHPVYMISEKIQRILDAYEDELIFKDVILTHKEARKQYAYYQILMDELDVQGEHTEYHPNGTMKKMVLDQEKIAHHHIFMIKDCQMRHPVVSLAVTESLLRRNTTGILFEEIEVR